jgi:hypothetical protein
VDPTRPVQRNWGEEGGGEGRNLGGRDSSPLLYCLQREGATVGEAGSVSGSAGGDGGGGGGSVKEAVSGDCQKWAWVQGHVLQLYIATMYIEQKIRIIYTSRVKIQILLVPPS